MLKKAELFKTVLPTKLLEFMACGRPVILGVDGEARKILDQARAGISVEPQNANELSTAIITLAANPQMCERFGQNGRNYIVQHFSREQTAFRYLGVLENLLKEGSLVPVA
jgi:glycosyltransferase involved in cell wall biosynthesis